MSRDSWTRLPARRMIRLPPGARVTSGRLDTGRLPMVLRRLVRA